MSLMSLWGWYREQWFALDSTLRERSAQLWERFQDRRRGCAQWAGAQTLEDLGEITARWLEGDLKYNPSYGYGDGPDPETEEIVPALVTLNRNGFVTSGSQPGHGAVPSGWGWDVWQRAAVDGFTDPDTADKLEAACKDAGLLFINNGRAGFWSHQRNAVPVTVTPPDGQIPDDDAGYHVHSTSGAHLSRRRLSIEQDGPPQGILRDHEQITIIDPIWGRKDHLWDVVTKAVEPPCCPCREA